MSLQQLFEAEDNWVTALGMFVAGERVVLRGKDLFTELHGLPWMGTLLLGVTGRRFDDKVSQFIDQLWTLCSSYPDPRIWNNRIAALAGTTRSLGALGIGAAIAASEATLYGGGADIKAIDFLMRAKHAKDAGESLQAWLFEQIRERRNMGGFGRPLVPTDERIEPVMRLAAKFGFENGEYVRLVHAIHEILSSSRYRLHMNVAALTAALLADQGISVREFRSITTLTFSAGMMACYVDASQHTEGTLFPMRASRIAYSGPEIKKW